MRFHGTARHGRRLFGAALLGGLLGLSLLGCGGSSNPNHILIPPTTDDPGNNLIATVSASPAQDWILQNGRADITFTLTDVNQALPGANLPVSFEVGGGRVPDPPTMTDANGQVTVTFIADEDFIGTAFIRIIQPTAQLRTATFLNVFEPACVLTAQVFDGMTPVSGNDDDCGDSFDLERELDNLSIIYTVMRPDPVTDVMEPVEGVMIHLTVTGIEDRSVTIGPTNPAGLALWDIVLEPGTGIGDYDVAAEVVVPDNTGSTGAPDGVADGRPCNPCTVEFDVQHPECNANVMLAIARTADGTQYGSFGGPTTLPSLVPGSTAYLRYDIRYSRTGDPIADEPFLVSVTSGTLDGGASTAVINTNGAGWLEINYTPEPGYSGTAMLSFGADGGALDCIVTLPIQVITCSLSLDFNSGTITAGQSYVLDVTVGNVDGVQVHEQSVALSAVGGSFAPPGSNNFELTGNMTRPGATGMGGEGTGTAPSFVVSPGFFGTGSISLSFTGDFPCDTVTAEFTSIDP
ncbi:MAG: Ig-like domain-containing protein [Acidobacteriota bacterium]